MSAPLSQDDWARLRRLSEEAVIDRIERRFALLPYQAGVVGLLEQVATRVLFIEKSRRIGLTWGLAAYAVLRAGRARDARGMDALYISYSREMTREFIDACGMWARAFGMAALAMEEFLFVDEDPEGDRSIQSFRIRFASGFEIVGLSSAPRSLRGKQGLVIIDEAAFVDSLKELLKAALAFLMWGGQVVVCSTHDGAENEFNVRIQDILAGRSTYRHCRIDFDQALQDGLYKRICLVKGDMWTPEAEAQWRADIIADYGDAAEEELFCVPSLSSGAWLPAPLIEARMTAEAPVLTLDLPPDFLHRPELDRLLLVAPFMADLAAALRTLDPERRHAFGFDFARVADLSVGVLLAIDGRLRRELALAIEMRRVPGDEQKAAVKTILSAAPRLVGAAFDATGMGWTVAEDMGRHFGLREGADGSGLVWPVKFSQDWYRLHMPPLKAAFEDDAIAIARNDDHLADLRAVKVVRGVAMVPPVRTGTGDRKRHGDFAIALALAHFASRQQWAEYGYRPVPPRRPADSGDDGRMHDRPDEDDGRDFRLAHFRRRGMP